jgi:hypothetical protein
MVLQYFLQLPCFLSLDQVELVATASWYFNQVWIIPKWTSWPIDVIDWCQHSSRWLNLNSWRRSDTLRSLLFFWMVSTKTEVIISGIGCRTVAYEVNHCAYLHKISVGVKMQVSGTSSTVPAMLLRLSYIPINDSIMGQIHNPCTHWQAEQHSYLLLGAVLYAGLELWCLRAKHCDVWGFSTMMLEGSALCSFRTQHCDLWGLIAVLFESSALRCLRACESMGRIHK